MLTIRRIGKRSFEVFRYGVPLGIVRSFVAKKVDLRPYPTFDEQNSWLRSRTQCCVTYLPSGEQCTVDRSNKGLGLI